MIADVNATGAIHHIDITVVAGRDEVTGLNSGAGVKLNSTDLFEEDDDAYFNYDVATSDVVYEPAGTYYIYVILNDISFGRPGRRICPGPAKRRMEFVNLILQSMASFCTHIISPRVGHCH